MIKEEVKPSFIDAFSPYFVMFAMFASGVVAGFIIREWLLPASLFGGG